jgi:serine/threonine-protein kinase
MADFHPLYRLNPKPIATGGQAVVTRAVHRKTGRVVALKQRKDGNPEAADRMRREIDVQSSIQHVNVMPILDADADDYAWFTMPLAESSLAEAILPLSTDKLVAVLTETISGLQVAHQLGFVHRDIKPSNILHLRDEHGDRWVVADWGIVRRPHGATTSDHTHTGVMLGTDGFAPPEAYADSHSASFSWDAYSLGRVAAWATTGTVPRPVVDLVAPEPWRRFVRVLTSPDALARPQQMSRVLELLSHVTTDVGDISGVSADALTVAKSGDANATFEILKAAQDHGEDADFFIDDLAHLLGPGLDEFVRQEPQNARFLLSRMDHHLGHIDWGRRNFDHYNVPLHWMQRVGQAAAAAGDLDLLEDACAVLFRHEPDLDRWRQAERSRAWLASLTGPAATRVAQVLRENPKAARYYGAMKHAADPSIRRVLHQPPI